MTRMYSFAYYCQTTSKTRDSFVDWTCGIVLYVLQCNV